MDAAPQLELVYAPSTRIELNEIWDYNEREYGRAHAEAYIDFLLAGIEALATGYRKGRPVNGFPDLQCITLRRNSRGHGHVIVYRIDLHRQIVRILHIYHTRQDIQGRLGLAE